MAAAGAGLPDVRVRDGECMSVPVKLKRVHPDAKVPAYAHLGDSGADLSSVADVWIGPRCFERIPLGVAIGLPPNYEAQIRPRSSLSAKGIVCAFGTIDEQYVGELSAVIYNLTPYDVHIEVGQRICQLVVAPVSRAQFFEVFSLDQTERGENGWGSSGQ